MRFTPVHLSIAYPSALKTNLGHPLELTPPSGTKLFWIRIISRILPPTAKVSTSSISPMISKCMGNSINLASFYQERLIATRKNFSISGHNCCFSDFPGSLVCHHQCYNVDCQQCEVRLELFGGEVIYSGQEVRSSQGNENSPLRACPPFLGRA